MDLKKLDDQEIEFRLQQLPGWQMTDGFLQRSYEFEDFKVAFSVMTQMAMEAENAGHHPNWFNMYNQLEIRLQTHDVKGITEYDLQLARIFEDIAQKRLN